MTDLFFRNKRLLILTVSLICVAGFGSLMQSPRMEDPLLTSRSASVITRFPGADAERVESLITKPLEDALSEFHEIKNVRSVSRSGTSQIDIELADNVYDAAPVWSRIRDKINDAAPTLPADAAEPEFEELEIKAFALLIAISWDDLESADEQEAADANGQQSKFEARLANANYSILRRWARSLKDRMLAVGGTEEVEFFGEPDEEIVAEVDASRLVSMGLTVETIAAQLQASDAKISAGQMRSRGSDLLVEVDSEFDSLARVGNTPIVIGTDGQVVRLADVASIHKRFKEPATSLAIVEGKPAVVLGVLVQPHMRIDQWAERATAALAEFQAQLPAGISANVIFDQNNYVGDRLEVLAHNLLLGVIAVVVVLLFLMGARSAVIVGTALPLTALMVLAGLRVLDIPIHQMSVTGLILAMGLLIDNAIVVVDEVSARMRDGRGPQQAISESVSHLAVPLFGSTLTTALAFAPISLMPGPAGEFVGSISTSVTLAIFGSLFLGLTVIPTLTTLGRESDNANKRLSTSWLRHGVSSKRLTAIYRTSLLVLFRYPVLGISLGVLLPIVGFIKAGTLSEQFFPPADRDQFQIEIELPAHSSLNDSLRAASLLSQQLDRHEEIRSVSWFVGRSGPAFYYNLQPRWRNTSYYSHAFVQLNSLDGARELIQALQTELDATLPEGRVLVRQLEQGPPFDAPVELRLYGPDLDVLKDLSDDVRQVLSQTPDVLHTRAVLAEPVPKLVLKSDEEQLRLAGLDHAAMSRQMDATLEGRTGGSMLETTEELPVRIRVANRDRRKVSDVASIDLLAVNAAPIDANRQADYRGVPVSSVAEIKVGQEVSSIVRLNRRRMNEVQAFITAGVLPARVLADFQQRLDASEFELPPGYKMGIGGESEKRDDAIGNLMASVGVLMVLMVATLVLSFGSFRLAALIGAVAALSVGLGLGSLWAFGFPFGFMAIVGTMGLVGVAINDTIVVLAAIREDPTARRGDPNAIADVVVKNTRHVVATSLTTIAGFIPLLVGGGGFWPPLAIAISGGVGGATILALYFAPSGYLLSRVGRSTSK